MADILGIDPERVGQTLAAVAVAFGAAWGARRSGAKQGRRAAEPETSVVAASFVERRQLADLITAITGLHGAMNVTNEHLEEINKRAHDEKVVKDAIAELRREQR